MNKFCVASLLSLTCLMSGNANAQSWQTTSDILAVALPVLAGAKTLQLNDRNGTVQLTWALGSTLLSTELIKSQINAVRPDGSGNDSFPSGHTAIAFASARFMQKRYGNDISPIALYGAATLTAIARVQANQHYWRDAVAGAALGYAMAEYFTETERGQTLTLLPTSGGWALAWQKVW